MIALRARAWRRRRFDGAAGEAPVVDVGHVLGPLAGREVPGLVEADEPVVGIFFADDKESLVLLTDGELSVYLEI